MTLSRVVPVMLYTIMCATHVRSQSCDADPDSDIKYDRTIGGAGVAPEGTSAFTTNMRGLSVDHASGTLKIKGGVDLPLVILHTTPQ